MNILKVLNILWEHRRRHRTPGKTPDYPLMKACFQIFLVGKHHSKHFKCNRQCAITHLLMIRNDQTHTESQFKTARAVDTAILSSHWPIGPTATKTEQTLTHTSSILAARTTNQLANLSTRNFRRLTTQFHSHKSLWKQESSKWTLLARAREEKFKVTTQQRSKVT